MSNQSIKKEPNLNGPETMPVRGGFNQPLPIFLFVYKLATDELVRKEELDFGNQEHRQWLGKITHWAITNGCQTEIMAVKDAGKEDKSK